MNVATTMAEPSSRSIRSRLVKLSKEIEIPKNKIFVVSGRLLPSARILLSSRIDQELIKPIVLLQLAGNVQPICLVFSPVGVRAIPIKFDLGRDIFPIFLADLPNIARGEVALSALATIALYDNMRTLKFDLTWQKKPAGCFSFGNCELALRRPGTVPTCRILQTDEALSLQMSAFFAQLRVAPAPVAPK